MTITLIFDNVSDKNFIDRHFPDGIRRRLELRFRVRSRSVQFLFRLDSDRGIKCRDAK